MEKVLSLIIAVVLIVLVIGGSAFMLNQIDDNVNDLLSNVPKDTTSTDTTNSDITSTDTSNDTTDVTIRHFSINDSFSTEFEFEEGMTWQEFVGSSYNTGSFSMTGSSVYYDGWELYFTDDESAGDSVYPTDTILSQMYYYWPV